MKTLTVLVTALALSGCVFEPLHRGVAGGTWFGTGGMVYGPLQIEIKEHGNGVLSGEIRRTDRVYPVTGTLAGVHVRLGYRGEIAPGCSLFVSVDGFVTTSGDSMSGTYQAESEFCNDDVSPGVETWKFILHRQ